MVLDGLARGREQMMATILQHTVGFAAPLGFGANPDRPLAPDQRAIAYFKALRIDYPGCVGFRTDQFPKHRSGCGRRSPALRGQAIIIRLPSGKSLRKSTSYQAVQSYDGIGLYC
jgi:hypothetical protein